MSLLNCPEKVLQLPIGSGDAARLSLGFPSTLLSQVMQFLLRVPEVVTGTLSLSSPPKNRAVFSLRTFAIQSPREQSSYHSVQLQRHQPFLPNGPTRYFFFSKKTNKMKKKKGGRCWVWGEGETPFGKQQGSCLGV